MRAFIVATLYEWSKTPYQKWIKKNEAWELSVPQLMAYPVESLGYHLGSFMLRHNFTLEPKLENHDVFHVLTGIGISVPEEIAMQFYLLGNGKKSLYLCMVILIGTLLYPDQWRFFLKAYRLGAQANIFHSLAYHKLLLQPIETIRTTFLIQTL